MKWIVFLITSVAIGVFTEGGNAEICLQLGQSWVVACEGETSGVDRFIIWTYRTAEKENDTFIAQCYFEQDCVHEIESRFMVRNSSSGSRVNSSLTVRHFTQSDEKLMLICYIWDANNDVLTFQINPLPSLCNYTDQTIDATTNRDFTLNNQTSPQPLIGENNHFSFTAVHIIVISAIAFIGIPLSVAVLAFVCRRWRPLLQYPSRGCLTNTYEDVRQFPLYYQQSSATQLPSYGGATGEHSFDRVSWDTDFEVDAGSTNGHVYLNGKGLCPRGDGESGNEVTAEEEQSHRFLPNPQPCRFQIVRPSPSCSPTPSSGKTSPSSGVRSLFKNLLLVKSERCQTNMTSCLCHSDIGLTSQRRWRDVTADKGKRGQGHSDTTRHFRETHSDSLCAACDGSRGLVECQTKSSNARELRQCCGPPQSLVPLNVAQWSSERHHEHCEFGGFHNCRPCGNHSLRESPSPKGNRLHAASCSPTNNHGMGRQKHQRAAATPSPNHFPIVNHSLTSNHSATNNHRMGRPSRQCASKHSSDRGATRQDNQPPTANHISVHRHQSYVRRGSGNQDVQLPGTTSQGHAGCLDYIEPRTSSASNSNGGSLSGSVTYGMDSYGH